jgi:magnesium transporter
VLWVDVDGLGDVDAIRQIGEIFGLHPLALEDVINGHQRPKVEQYEGYLFIVARMASLEGGLATEQLGMFLGKDYVVTFQELLPGDTLEPVRGRLRNAVGRIRAAGPDYLAYALLDAIIDHCFPVLEALGDSIQELENELLETPDISCVHKLHEYKRTLMQMRRFVWPERDVVSALLHDESGIIAPQTRVFLRDCYDHAVQIMDLVESYRDVTAGLLEMYISSVSLRTNEIMRVLTVVSAIFIPLTFVAGIYGMNFDNMPELKSRYGYFICLGLMVLIGAGQLYYFRRKKWV